MPAASPATVRAAFDAVQTSVASEDVLRKAARVCEEFGLAADALASHWESFALNNSATFDTDSLSSKALDALRAHVKRAEAARRKKQARSTTFRRGAGGSSLNKVSIKGAFSTPSPPKRSLPTSSSQTQKAAKTAKTANAVASAQAGRMKSFVKMTSTYKERPLKSRGVHAAKPFNGEALRQGGASATKGGAAPQHRCKITLLSEELSGDITKTGAMHMYTPPARKAEVLERELHVMAERLIRAHNLGGAPADGEDGMEASSSSSSSSSSSKAALADTLLEPVGMPSQTSVLMCGRVCCHVESRDGVGTLNAESLLLEGSRSRSNGVRVRLDVSRVPSLDLFPGQIVIVRGTNPSGTTMIAEQIYSSAPAPRATTSVADLRAMNHADASRPADLDDEGGITDVAPSLGGRPLEMLVAAGPFCVVDDLEYEPLEDFVNEVIERKPDVVLLIGPFVDTTNQKIKLGDIQLDGGETGEFCLRGQQMCRPLFIFRA